VSPIRSTGVAGQPKPRDLAPEPPADSTRCPTTAPRSCKGAHEAAVKRQQEITDELETPDKQVAKAARKRHHSRRAAETATADAIAANPQVPQPPVRPVPPSLALPAPDEDEYDLLADPDAA
jgi:hypothetical protein